MNQPQKLFAVHWKTQCNQTGHGDPLSHSEAMEACQEGYIDYPDDEYWIEEAQPKPQLELELD